MITEATETGGQSRVGTAAAVLVTVLILWTYVTVSYNQISDGRLFVDDFPADAAFIIDIILRISAGQVPHVDFTLHLGALPYVMAGLADAPTPIEGFFIAQTLFTGVCLAIGLWVWWTRLGALSGPLLLVFILILGQTVSLPTRPDVTLAVFYNRWGWVLTLLFACQTLLPSRSRDWRTFDGAVTGLLGFCLFATKITFFVGILPAAILCNALRGQWREMLWGFFTFAALVLVVFVAEPALWPGYLENMAWAASNPLRPKAGGDMIGLLTGAAFWGYTAVIAIFLLLALRSRGVTEALWLTLAAIGFYFIQYQNFGNAPFWLLFLAIFAMVQAGQSDDGRWNVTRAAWALLSAAYVLYAVTLLLPMVYGMLQYGPRMEAKMRTPFPPEGPIVTGVRFPPADIGPIVSENTLTFEEPTPYTGDPECRFISGWAGSFLAIAETLKDLPGPAFITDSISPHWYLVGVEPVRGLALWNYGSVRGIENTDFVIVPKCALKPDFKREILREIDRTGEVLTPFLETEHAMVYRRAASGN